MKKNATFTTQNISKILVTYFGKLIEIFSTTTKTSFDDVISTLTNIVKGDLPRSNSPFQNTKNFRVEIHWNLQGKSSVVKSLKELIESWPLWLIIVLTEHEIHKSVEPKSIL